MTVDRQKEWLEICKGLRAHKVAGILNRHDPKGRWTRCNKTQMSQVWVDAHNGNVDCIADVAALRKELEEAPRKPKSRKSKAQAKEEPAAPVETATPETRGARIESLASDLKRALGGSEGLTDLAAVLLRAEPTRNDLELLLETWDIEKERLEAKIDFARRELCGVVHLCLATKKAKDMMTTEA